MTDRRSLCVPQRLSPLKGYSSCALRPDKYMPEHYGRARPQLLRSGPGTGHNVMVRVRESQTRDLDLVFLSAPRSILAELLQWNHLNGYTSRLGLALAVINLTALPRPREVATLMRESS